MEPIKSTIVVTPEEHNAMQELYKQHENIQKQSWGKSR